MRIVQGVSNKIELPLVQAVQDFGSVLSVLKKQG
jgi:hypothetical protein